MRDRALLLILAMSLSAGAQAQIIHEPTPAPLVTGDNASWFSLGEPVEWNGHLYYPTGTQEQFNPYQMVPDGSYRGVPLYTSSAREPGSTVFVPLSSGLMKPYLRRLTEEPGTTGVPEAPSAPTGGFTSTEGVTVIYQALAVPAPAPAPVAAATLRSMSEPMASAKAAPHIVSTLIPPAGVNGIWVNYDGHRWFLAGKAIEYDAAALAEVGTYHGWSVYSRKGDRSTIYIPTTPGRLAPYAR
jgi:hypothetical protein